MLKSSVRLEFSGASLWEQGRAIKQYVSRDKEEALSELLKNVSRLTKTKWKRKPIQMIIFYRARESRILIENIAREETVKSKLGQSTTCWELLFFVIKYEFTEIVLFRQNSLMC